MIASSRATAFLATTDADRARRFYEGVLDLQLASEDDFALEFALQGALLRIARVDSFQPHTFTSLGWRVENLGDAAAWLAGRGVVFERFEGMDQDEAGIWRVPGSQGGVAWFKDPDGNLLSVSGPL